MEKVMNKKRHQKQKPKGVRLKWSTLEEAQSVQWNTISQLKGNIIAAVKVESNVAKQHLLVP